MPKTPRWVGRLLTAEDLDALARAIAAAEAQTSGEIRVHLERRLPRRYRGDTLARARDVFLALEMTRTVERNGVLIYVAIEDHRLAIMGDEGIHTRVGEAYWNRLRDLIVERLRAGQPHAALAAAITEVGRTLTAHFPRRKDDRNELSDSPSIG